MNALLKGRVVYGLPSTTLLGRLKQASDFHMYSPDIEHKNLRQRLVKEHRELLGKARAFNGMLHFMARKLEQPVTEVYSTMRDNTKVRITITFVTEVPPNSPAMSRYLLGDTELT